jgi:hypothetical protein
MWAAMWIPSRATWLKSRWAWCARKSAKRSKPRPTTPPKSGCSTLWWVPGASSRDPRELPQEAARRRSGRQGNRDRRGRRGLADPGAGHPRHAAGRCQHDQSVRLAGQRLWRAHQEAAHDGQRSAYEPLINEEADKLLDESQLQADAIKLAEEEGIVFLDEIDKVAARAEAKGADVSREGVQRDLLPLIEGATVATKYGPMKTDHVLFIASGAFHVNKPSDLAAGACRADLPIRVELQALTRDDFRAFSPSRKPAWSRNMSR